MPLYPKFANLSTLVIFIISIAIINTTAQNCAMNLDGIDDYIEIADNPSINFDTNDDFTVEAWVRIPSTQTDLGVLDNMILEKWYYLGEPYPFVIRVFNSLDAGREGRIVALRYDETNNPGIVSSIALNDDTWHHIAFVKNGGTLYLYIDGVLDGTTADTTTGTTQNNSPLYVGRRGVESAGIDGFWSGSIDELRIWNVAKTQSEIASGMNTSLLGNEAGLVLYYNFNRFICDGDNTSVSTLQDISSAGNDGTLNNFTLNGNASNFVGASPAVAAVPTLSQWGLIILSLIFLIFGVTVMLQSEKRISGILSFPKK